MEHSFFGIQANRVSRHIIKSMATVCQESKGGIGEFEEKRISDMCTNSSFDSDGVSNSHEGLEILQETTVQKLFEINIDGVVDPMAWKYYTLRRDYELAKLKKRLMELDLVLCATFQIGVPFNFDLHSPPIHCVQSPHIYHAHSPNTRITN